MGRTLLVAVALWTAAGTARAQQPQPQPQPAPAPAPTAADLFKQGQDLYVRGDFVTAVGAFTRALELEPNNAEYKLSLADAERQAGQCDKAIPHYRELLDAPGADKDRVKANLTQCPNAVVIEVKKETPPPPAPAAQIVYRDGTPTKLTIGLLAGAGLCLGGSIVMFLASRDSDGDADAARSYDDYQSISSRADRQKIYSVVLLASALGLGGYAIYRFKFKSERTEVAVTPTSDGGAMVVRGSW